MRETRELEVDDRDRAVGLAGHKVAVSLNNVEASGVKIIATLDEVREDGILLSEIGELGPGPTMFCPWDSLRRVCERPSWLMMPHEEPEEAHQAQEFFELREATPEEAVPEPPEPHQHASARSLDRVVPIGQRQTVGEITVALTSLELFEEGLGVLRYRISHEGVGFEDLPMPELVVRDGSGNVLSWSPQGTGGGTNEADGDVEVRDLPETGVIDVEVTRLVSLMFDEEAGEEVEEDACDGPWSFRFSI